MTRAQRSAKVSHSRMGLLSSAAGFIYRSSTPMARSWRLAWAFALVIVLVCLASGPAFAVRGHVLAGSFGTPGSGAGQFKEPTGLAVNEATGDVYVLDTANNRVEIFNATGSKFEGEFNGSGLLPNEGKAAGSGGLPEEAPTGQFNEPVGIAVDNDPSSPSYGDVYVADSHGNASHKVEITQPVVDKFSASGKYIGQITRNPTGEPSSGEGVFRELLGVAVDSHGEVWVEEQNFGSNFEGFKAFNAANYTNAVANVRIASRSVRPEPRPGYGSPVPSPSIPGFAVDSEDNMYLHTRAVFAREAEPLVELNDEGQPISLKVDEESPTGVAVELSSNDVYVSHLTNVHRLDGALKSLESLVVPGGHGSGVAIDAATSTVYVAESTGAVDVYGPESPGVPTVSAGSESVGDVTATSASFSAEVNPRSEPYEEATSYSFEYGPCDTPTTCASSPYVDSTPVPEGVLAANYEPDVVSAHPQDLVAHTAYHMRLVAHNSHPGVAEGEELTFTTQASGAFVLPDGRAWELVSPPDKYGADIQANYGGLSKASLAGGAITYHAEAPIEAQPPGNYGGAVQALAVRTAAGWSSRDIDAPHETTPGSGAPTEYPFFSADLTLGVLQSPGALVPSLSAEASEQTPFLRSDFAAGDPTQICTNSCYTPLVTGAPGVENVPPGTVFGGFDQTGGECVAATSCGPIFVGASPDASHILLTYPWAPLVEGAPLHSLYEWAAGRLSVVSVLPNGTPATANSILGSKTFQERVFRNAVSENGSRVVWSSGSHLYLRDTERESEKTVQLDEVQGGSGTGTSEPGFQTASSDGSRIFFTDSQRLTADSSGPADLYECDVVEEAGSLKCRLTDLTGGSGESAGVRGLIPGVSEDGSYVYFIAGGALPGTQANERGETASAGQPNLYVRHEGVTRLVAVLSSELTSRSKEEADATDWSHTFGTLTARVSPDGRWLAFMSDRPLTGYDNRDALSGERDEEVFLYHAGENGEGKLVCASCNPTGGRPHGTVIKSTQGGSLGPGGYESLQGVAAVLPGWTTEFYQSRYLSDSGRMFFDSYDALVPQDVNNAEDAYQFEPAGVGGCTGSSTTLVVASDGCVGLISSGTSKEPSAFVDASESGGDVFFLTSAQLSPLDTDTALDIYDAHECAPGEVCTQPPPTPVPACEGDACQSPVAAPEDPTPGSLTYQGPGNPPGPVLVAKAKSKSKPAKCSKGSVEQHGRCVKKKAKKSKRAKAKRSNRRVK